MARKGSASSSSTSCLPSSGESNARVFKTTNAGVDWDQVLTPNVTAAFYGGGQITGASMDPPDHQNLVVESHGESGCGAITCIAETTDAGTTWKLLQIPTGWAENSSVVIVNKTTWLYPTIFGGVWRTANQGATWTQASTHGASGKYYEPYIYQASNGRYLLPSVNGLIQSAPNDTSSWTQVANAQGLTLIPTQTHLVMSNEFKTDYSVASQSDPATWTTFPSPPQSGPSSQGGGGVYLVYDNAHHILYSSNFNAWLWRIVTD